MEDNKDLINEIDKLDDNAEVSEEKEKSTSHEKVFTVVIVMIIIAALAMFYLSYKGTYIVSNKENKRDDYSAYLKNVDINEENTNTTNEKLSYEEQENQKVELAKVQLENVSITYQSRDIEGHLIAVLHNGNQESVENILVQVIFYNGENKPIKITEYRTYMVDGGTDYYMTFIDTPEEYERCDFLISKDIYYIVYDSRRNDISFNVEESDENTIKIYAKNNSDYKIREVLFALVYYNENDQIISISERASYTIKKNKDFKLEIDKKLYNYETCEEVPYSRYEVVLLHAISDNFDN